MRNKKNIPNQLFTLLCVLLFGFIGIEVQATHIVGADMTFECLGNDFYKVHLTVRRDCINGADDAPFDDPARVGIFDAFGNNLDFLGAFGYVEMDKVSQQFIESSLPDCSYLGAPLCVEEADYEATVFLPFREKGYVLAYQRCCRNITLNNVANPTQTGNTSFICLTETTLLECNSMPAFGEWADIVVCANQPYVFDHSAFDRDGDSLAYMFHIPHAGASEANPKPFLIPGPQYDEIEYASGFDLENQLGPGSSIAIDPNSGLLTANPTIIGQFLVGVLVEEWRNGELLSKARRNFEMNVRVCDDIAAVSFEAEELTCDGLEVAFTNTSSSGFGFEWDFNVNSDDPMFISTVESPTFVFPAEGFYDVRLTSTNPENGCAFQTTRTIGVFESEVEANFESAVTACDNDLLTLTLAATSTEPNPDFEIEEHRWEVVVDDEIIPLFGSTVQTTIDCDAEVKVALTSFSENGCSDMAMRIVDLDPDTTGIGLIDLVGDTVRICIGDAIALLNSSMNGVTYTWSPLEGLTFSDMVNFSDPIASPTETTLYSVTATNGTETEEAMVLVIVDTKPEFTFGADSSIICRSGGQLTTIDGSAAFDYDWSPSDQVNTSSPFAPNNPQFLPDEDGFFFVTVTNGACVIIDSVYVDAIGDQPEDVDAQLDLSEIIVNNGDGTLDVELSINLDILARQFDIDSIYWVVTAGGETFTESGPVFTGTIPATRDAVAMINIVDSNGCIITITRRINSGDTGGLIQLVGDTIRICIGDETPLLASSVEGVTYTWSPLDDLAFMDQVNFSDPIASPTETTLYTVTATDGVLTDEASVLVIVDMKPQFSFGSDTTIICRSGGQITTIEGDPEFEYVWSPADQVNTASPFAPNDPQFLPTDDGFFFVTVTNGACVIVDSIYVDAIGDSPLDVDEQLELIEEVTDNEDGTVDVNLSINLETLSQMFDIDSIYWIVMSGGETFTSDGPTFFGTIPQSQDAVAMINIVDSNGCVITITRVISTGATGGLINLVGDTIRICIGDSANLLSNSAEGVMYTWMPTNGLTFMDTINFSDPIASPIETTTYTVTATDGMLTDEATVVVIVDMKPTFDFGADSTALCQSGDIITTIIADESFEYEWSPADQVNTANPFSPSSPEFSPRGDGFFFVTVTNGACVIVDSVYVIALGNDPIALDEQLEITPEIMTNTDGTIDLGVPVNWEELDELFDIDSVYWTITTEVETIDGTDRDVTAVLQSAMTATIDLFIRDTDGCIIQITRVIDLGNPPSIEFINEDTISVCIGDTSFIVANPNPEWVYTWDPEEGLIFEDPDDRSNPRISPTDSQLYRVTVSDGAVSVVDSIFIEALSDSLELSIVSDGNICDGVSAVEAQVADPTDGIVYEWALDPSFDMIVATGPMVNIPITGDSATIYLRANAPDFCGSNIDSVQVTNNSIDVDIEIQEINTCIEQNGLVRITNNDEAQEITILWDQSDNILTEDLTSDSIEIVRIGDEDQIVLTYEISNNLGCTRMDSVMVPVTDELILMIGGDDQSCTTTGSFFALANAPLDQVNLEWSLSEDFSTILSTEDSVTADLGETGIIYLRGSTAAGCESEIVSQMLEMQDLTIEEDAPSRICPGDTADVDLVFPDGESFEVTWTADPSIVSELSGTEVIIVGLGGADTISLSYMADNGAGCQLEGTIEIVNSQVVDPNPSNEVVCGTLDQTFMIDPIYEDGDVMWDFGTLGGVATTSMLANPTISYDSAGNYTVALTSIMETCNFEPITFDIEVPEVLELTTDNDLDQSSCDSGELVLGVETNGTVGWTDQDGNLLGTGDSLRIDATGLNRITATAIDESGCTQTLTFVINQYMFDITTDAPTEPVCDSDGNGLIITATDETGANLSYQWTSAGGIISGSNSPVVTVDPTMSQDLQLEVTNQDLGCSITISVPVTGGSLDGSITSDPVDGNIRRTESATLTVDPMGDNITYQWDDGNTDGVRTVTPLETTTYTVTITDNDTGCTDIESVTINVEQPICDEPEIFIPLAFSPNGDGENDELIVRGNIIETVDLQVLDRWGREVFRGQRVGEGWNGQHRNTGDDLSPDMYAYCLKVVCSDGTEFLKSGSISLVR